MYVADVKLGKHMRTTERVLVSALRRIQLAELLPARDFFSQSQHLACSNENPKQLRNYVHCNSKAAKIISLLEINNQACKISP